MINNRWPERPATRGLLMPITVSSAATVIEPGPHRDDLERADAGDRGVERGDRLAAVFLGDRVQLKRARANRRSNSRIGPAGSSAARRQRSMCSSGPSSGRRGSPIEGEPVEERSIRDADREPRVGSVQHAVERGLEQIGDLVDVDRLVRSRR